MGFGARKSGQGWHTLFPAVTWVAPTDVTYGHDGGNADIKLELGGGSKLRVPSGVRHSPGPPPNPTPLSPEDTITDTPVRAS